MYESIDFENENGLIIFRKDTILGTTCRISPGRLKRGLSSKVIPEYSKENCPFCPENIHKTTPVFEDGKRISVGESITFPNMYPYAPFHVVTVITRKHQVSEFTHKQLSDALRGQVMALRGNHGYPSINWNYLPSSGASLVHPHMQGLIDEIPGFMHNLFLKAQCEGSYIDDLIAFEKKEGRVFDGLNNFWYANPVPLGEREIRVILSGGTVDAFSSKIQEFASDLIAILKFLRSYGSDAFNMSLFFGNSDDEYEYCAIGSIIARINPNSMSISDSAFMERLHLSPVIMTLPEDLAHEWNSQVKM